jgi:hypothetical protein
MEGVVARLTMKFARTELRDEQSRTSLLPCSFDLRENRVNELTFGAVGDIIRKHEHEKIS